MNEKELSKRRTRKVRSKTEEAPQSAVRWATVSISTEPVSVPSPSDKDFGLSSFGSSSIRSRSTESTSSRVLEMADGIVEIEKALEKQTVSDDQNPVKQLREAVRSARKRVDLSQQQLAELVGVHISFIAHLETLKENGALPSHSRTATLERILQKQPGELWQIVERARSFMEWRRVQVREHFKALELSLQGIDVNRAYNVEREPAIRLKQFQLPLGVEEAELLELLDIIEQTLKDPSRWKKARRALQRSSIQESSQTQGVPSAHRRKDGDDKVTPQEDQG